MFSIAEKYKIAKAVEDVIKEIDHPEMDNENIKFNLHIDGKEVWSWADIHENLKRPGKSSLWNEVSGDGVFFQNTPDGRQAERDN